jgi:hypothetical protein
MRRHHNVFAATLLIFGIIYLSTPPEHSLFDRFYHHHSTGTQKDAGTILRGEHILHSKSQATASSTKIRYLGSSSLASLPGVEQAPVRAGSQHATSPAEQPPSSHGSSHLRPAEPPPQPPSTNNEPPPAKPEFAFQENLELDFPFAALQQFSTHAPLHYDPNGPKTYAYATFMATRNPSLKDPYFLAILSVVHRILWSPRTRTQKYPFIVFVADFVTAEQRALLSGAGAVVRQLAPLEWHCEKPGYQKRWNDLFAKLNMWAETDFSRILFLDADAFPLQNIDDMFDVAPVQECKMEKLDLDDVLPGLENICTSYVFAGVPQSPFSPD